MSLHQTLARLVTVRDRWPDLEEARLHGTPRPWQHTEMTEIARAERSRRDRQERADIARLRLPVMGYSRAPLHVDILDTMAAILMDADLLHEAIAQAIGHPTLAHPASAYDDPWPYLEYAIELLTEATETDRGMIVGAAEYAEAMERAMLVVFGEFHDGQVLNAVCPFCCGRTFVKPAGEKTLRVRIVPDHRDETKTEVVVACENPDGCRPFAAECGMWVKGRPAWPWSQWEWLSERLLRAS